MILFGPVGTYYGSTGLYFIWESANYLDFIDFNYY